MLMRSDFLFSFPSHLLSSHYITSIIIIIMLYVMTLFSQ
jgi:hypothetical protein